MLNVCMYGKVFCCTPTVPLSLSCDSGRPVIHVLVAVGLFTSVMQEMWQNKSAVLCTCFVR